MATGTAQELVLQQVRQLIASGELRPGQQIVQDSLANNLGVSRVPLREALKVLEGEGQVTYHPHRGYFVANLSVTDLVEVYRIRAILEDEALRVGIPLVTDEQLKHIESLAQVVRKASQGQDVASISAANRAFHFAIFEASNLPRLVRLIRNLWDATDAYRAVFFASSPNREHMNSEHDELVAALRNRDVAAAIAAQHAHREGSVTAVSQLIN